MTRIKIVAIIMLMIISVHAHATSGTWKQYFENAKGLKYYIDTSSIVSVSNGVVRAWQKTEKNAGDGYGMLFLLEVDCKQRKYIYRDAEPIKVTAANVQYASMYLIKEWSYFAPNDLDDATRGEWCRQVNK